MAESNARREHVTELLAMAGEGDSRASEALLPLVYDELRRLARAQVRKEQGSG